MSVMALRYEDIPIRDSGFTVADLDELPDDGRRYEVVDGVLLVSPAPRWQHQYASPILDLDGGTYRESALVHGDELVSIDIPFSISLRPADLLTR